MSKMSIANGDSASNDKKIKILGKFKLCKYGCGKSIAWAEKANSTFWINEDGFNRHDCPNKPDFKSQKHEDYYRHRTASIQELFPISRIDTTEQTAAKALSKSEQAERHCIELKKLCHEIEARVRRLEYELQRR